MIQCASDNVVDVSGAMTLPYASGLLAEGNSSLQWDKTLFNLAAVTDVDSSGLAVVFGWLRQAQRLGKSIGIANPPRELLSLAEVYGVSEFFPLA